MARRHGMHGKRGFPRKSHVRSGIRRGAEHKIGKRSRRY